MRNAVFNSIIRNSAGASVDYATEGYDFLTANARTFHDFTQLSGAHAITITTSEDLTANNRDLTNNPGGLYTANTPTVFSYMFPSLDSEKSHYTFSNQPLLFGNNTTNSIFSTSHEIHIATAAKSKNFILRLFGVNSTQVHYAQIETDGKISLFIKRAASTTRLRSVNPVFTATVQNADLGNVIVLGFAYGFTAGSEYARMYINGVEIATELVSGTAVASWDSGYSWNNLYSFAVGAEASATNTTGNSKPHWNYKFAVTAPLTTDERNLVVHQMLNSAPQSGNIVLLGESKMPFCTATKTYYCPVYLREAPASDVTITVTGDAGLVTITGSSLTFTSANYNTPQVVKIVGVTNQGYQPTDITFTATGGLSEVKTKEIIITESRTGTGGKDGSDVYLTDGWNATRVEANAISISSVTDLRNAIIDTLFKGDYPTGGPETTTTPTSYGGVTLANANAGAKNRYKFSEQDENGDEYRNYVAHVRNTSPNNKLFFQFFGHGESYHQELYDQVIATGYDWAGACMAFAVENEEDSAAITASPSWLGHDQLYTGGIDTATFDARRLFLFDKIRFLEYIVTQHTYTKIVIAGVSGGGWMAMMIGTILQNIDVIFADRGVNSYNHPESGSDFEQGPSFLTEFTGGATASEAVSGPRIVADYRTLGYLKRMILACGNGADFHHISHELDPLGGANYIQIPIDLMEAKATALGGGMYYQYINKNAGQSTHGFNTAERTYIIANLP
jgi:hypothetical protein